MTNRKTRVHIIGAGVSGLIAAKVLEEHGYCPIVLEGSDRVGGRVKTDIVDGFQLDRGFQVLLSSYPAAMKWLDYNELELQPFKSGSYIFVNGRHKVIGDPKRDIFALFSTLFSGIGTFRDKLKILKLNNLLQEKSIEEIFDSTEVTTFQYLKDFGFSDDMIKKFFRPFFSGIYLETELETSSRMFEFVFKMFGVGSAVIPKAGMEAIPQQLEASLRRTTFKFNTKVKSVTDGQIILEDGSEITTDYAIVATDATGLVPSLIQDKVQWKSCKTLYFSVPNTVYPEAYIGLIANPKTLINNLLYHTNLAVEKKGRGHLLSVTVVDDQGLSDDELIQEVKKELVKECGITETKLIKIYTIPKALPQLSNLKYDLEPAATKISAQTFVAGDTLVNGSLNSAMLSGEKAALAVLSEAKNG